MLEFAFMAGKRVLIVEIERGVSREMRVNLERLQREVEVIDVLSGEEAIVVFQCTPVDLVVVDTHLPGMDAHELIGKLRAQKPDLNLILLNGQPTPLSARQLSGVHADAILKKPIHSLDFLDAVAHVLGSSHTQPSANPVPEIETFPNLENENGKSSPTAVAETDEIDPKMDEMLQSSVGKKVKTDDLDAFWASNAQSSRPHQAGSDSLTYDQAQEKGLLSDNGPASE